MSIRNYLYDHRWLSVYKSSLPVICVGNLSTGGNGKTPLVMYLVKMMSELNFRPVVLSRGYKSRQTGPLLVSPHHSFSEVGDEALMLTLRAGCPVVISGKRAEGAKYIEKNDIGNLIILDDGFQHRALARDLNLLSAYVGDQQSFDEFRQGSVLPAGKFREEKQKGLKRADAIIFSSRSVCRPDALHIAELAADLPADLPVFTSYLLAEGVYAQSGSKVSTPAECDAFCALGNPRAFFESVEKFGIRIINRTALRDHANYSSAVIDGIVARAAGRCLICSEKDAVKIDLIRFPQIYVLRTALVVDPLDSFCAMLSSILTLKK